MIKLPVNRFSLTQIYSLEKSNETDNQFKHRYRRTSFRIFAKLFRSLSSLTYSLGKLTHNNYQLLGRY